MGNRNRRDSYDYDEYDEYDGYEDEPSKRRSRPVKRKRKSSRASSGRRKKAIAIFAVEIVVLLILLVGAYVLFARMGVTSAGKTNLSVVKTDSGEVDFAKNEIAVNEAVADNAEMKGYRNIALFGVDARDGQLKKNTRSDTIIICSINQDNGEIKLVSVYRDTYLNLSNDKYNKCNSAYAKGGPAQAIRSLF